MSLIYEVVVSKKDLWLLGMTLTKLSKSTGKNTTPWNQTFPKKKRKEKIIIIAKTHSINFIHRQKPP